MIEVLHQGDSWAGRPNKGAFWAWSLGIAVPPTTQHSVDLTVPALTPDQLIEEYAKVRVHYTEKGDISRKKAPSYHRGGLVNNPFRSHPFFVNGHHYLLTARNYPGIVDLVEGSGRKPGRVRLAVLKINLPLTFDALSRLGYLS